MIGNCKILNAPLQQCETGQGTGSLPLKFNLVWEALANAVRRDQLNHLNFRKEVKTVPLSADSMTLHLVNSGSLTKKKTSLN